MKKIQKILLGMISFFLFISLVYATVTIANNRRGNINKLPWNGNGSGSLFDTAHDIGGPLNSYQGDVTRFSWILGTSVSNTSVVKDSRTGLMWQTAHDGVTKSWDDAKLYCANLTLGGYTDWRLPNVSELLSLADYGYSANNYWYEPYFNFGTSEYWSSTTRGDNTTVAFAPYFNPPLTGGRTKTASFIVYVICTR